MNLITPLYAAIFALLYVVLSVRTLLLRRQCGVAIGPGEEPELARAVRAHGNFSEYVPISLILMVFLEISSEHVLLIHGLGLTLLAGRCLHAWGVSQVKENFAYRVTGMALTFTVIISCSLRIIASYLPFLGNGG